MLAEAKALKEARALRLEEATNARAAVMHRHPAEVLGRMLPKKWMARSLPGRRKDASILEWDFIAPDGTFNRYVILRGYDRFSSNDTLVMLMYIPLAWTFK